MNTQTAIKSDWNETKSKIKARFDKLSDDSIESMKGNLELLSGKLQSAYGYAKEQAESEFATFKASLHAATEPVNPVKEESKVVPKPASPGIQKVG